ncbi:hypothetical protein G6F46_006516 [Rhizopus delemar]|uniref:DH domain-containing protein n=2 Tax=Rhizopus TaxID=4842 RepID=A0A9P7CPQ6_9FUNG|nr:hypothetical protein G6F55_005198 [Rhizopus delemar]KAG1543484.1 hypothetical protein G6F51_006647 [Rhizopus arrhizus]KAG1499966.1 hypothetical protein G6F54_004042 [Rhizopus delemar]KAG1513612.1 hypothetical protein G6F53_004304 [Rhizopus delemar]KAG1523913.1 hypothetical protein G6F52_004626 [Rhizopus delemar]
MAAIAIDSIPEHGEENDMEILVTLQRSDRPDLLLDSDSQASMDEPSRSRTCMVSVDDSDPVSTPSSPLSSAEEVDMLQSSLALVSLMDHPLLASSSSGTRFRTRLPGQIHDNITIQDFPEFRNRQARALEHAQETQTLRRPTDSSLSEEEDEKEEKEEEEEVFDSVDNLVRKMIEKETSPTVETNQEVSTSRNSLIDLDQILIEGSPAAQEPIVRKDAPLVSDVASSIHETNPADPPSQQPPVTAEQEDKGPPAPEEEVKSPEPERQDRFVNAEQKKGIEKEAGKPSEAGEVKTEEKKIKKKQKKRLQQRYSVMNELLATEDSYAQDLNSLCNHFFELIRSVNYVNHEEKRIICRNGNSLMDEQSTFCESLRLAIRLDRKKGGVKYTANCFLASKTYFESYYVYCVHQDKAIAVYNRLLEINSDFAELDERMHFIHQVITERNKLMFKDYMIMPFQRLLRYKLLLETLRHTTTPNTKGHTALSAAEEAVHAVAKKINDRMARVELEEKTEIFLSRLHADWSIPKQWYRHLGICRLIGTFDMRCLPKQKSFKRVCCALFKHYVILVKPKKPDVYEADQWFPIREFRIEDAIDIPSSLHFPWLLRNKSYLFEFCATSELEKEIWMETMESCIADAKARHKLLEKESVSDFVEEIFESNLDLHSSEDDDQPVRIPLPSGSTSFSQSAIFSKSTTVRKVNSNRRSIPNLSTFFSSDQDTTKSFGKVRWFIGSLAEKLLHFRLKQFKIRCDAFDAHFKDVYVSFLITAKGSHKIKRTLNTE